MTNLLALVLILLTPVLHESGWSQAEVVRHGDQAAVRVQARIDGDYLFVRLSHEAGWHSYAMDNEARSKKALQGKKSLGVEQGLEIIVQRGIELDTHWLQSPPQDFSQPRLRWYSYGFAQTALLACRVQRETSDPIVIQVRGQACHDETCHRIDVMLELTDHRNPAVDPTALQKLLRGLVPVIAEELE